MRTMQLPAYALDCTKQASRHKVLGLEAIPKFDRWSEKHCSRWCNARRKTVSLFLFITDDLVFYKKNQA